MLDSTALFFFFFFFLAHQGGQKTKRRREEEYQNNDLSAHHGYTSSSNERDMGRQILSFYSFRETHVLEKTDEREGRENERESEEECLWVSEQSSLVGYCRCFLLFLFFALLCCTD